MVIKMKIFKVKVPPFPGFVTVISGSYDELIKELKRRGLTEKGEIIEPGDFGMTLKIDTAKGRAIAILLLPEISDSAIWHECLHASWYILDAFGIYADVINHEILAYMQDHLHEQIKKRL